MDDGDGPPAAKRRRRGGQRQRLSRFNIDDENIDGGEHGGPGGGQKSNLVRHLLHDFAWGVQSAQKVQASAMASLKDLQRLRIMYTTHADPAAPTLPSTIEDDVSMVATIGCSGQYQNKRYSDLMSRIEPNLTLPKPHKCKMKFAGKLGEQTQEMLLPHEMFAAFYSNTKFWQTVILPDEDHPLTFWHAQREGKHPQWNGHPLQEMDDAGLSKVIPVSLHGDEVPVTGLGKQWTKKMVNWSWHSMLSRVASVKHSQFYIWSMFDKAGLDEGGGGYSTMDHFFRVLCCSFRAMFEGIWPTCDVEGRKHTC